MQYSMVKLLALLSLAQLSNAKESKVAHHEHQQEIRATRDQILNPKSHIVSLQDRLAGKYNAARVPHRMIHKENAKIHQRRDLKKGRRAGRNQQHEVVFAVKQNNLDEVKRILDDVSNPRSANF